MTEQPIGAIQQDGQVWLSATDLIAAMRDRARRFDLMAEQEPMDGWEPDVYRTACWSVTAELIERADTLDLLCMAKVNEERTST